ncbi:MAG: T9SS type A sorting domain-containing protein [Ignavibacteria bacterium]|nr:T9SS type A sorting domain-containing protein [Ignavibacteria bacterium]
MLMINLKKSSFVFPLFLIILLPFVSFAQVPVIPGAEGWGTTTPAGRGGTILRVTNLNASGPGSLRDALAEDQPRVIIFEISGTIVLDEWLFIDDPFVTVAGQTAPSPGITIRGAGIRIRTHDVLLQHLRVRVGDKPGGPPSQERDGLEILASFQNCYNIVVDHCSFSWAIDENISIYSPSTLYSNHDITFRYCITSEGLYNSSHPKGARSMGLNIGGNTGGRQDSISLISNLFAHNNQRNPSSLSRSLVLANNLAYNCGDYGVTLASDILRNHSSLVGNVFIPGSDTDTGAPITLSSELIPGSLVYLEDNRSDGYESPYHNWSGFNPIVNQPPFWPQGLIAEASNTTRLDVLANAGARPTDRDEVDARIIADALNGTGSLIDSQDDVGGWPTLAVNTRPLVTPPNPHGDSDGDGYTNLEEWIHSYTTLVGGDENNKMIGLVSPNGGEILVADSVAEIRWETAGPISQVKLEYSLGGIQWLLIEDAVANDFTYDWAVPNAPGSNVYVRVSDASDASIIDQSDDVFTITHKGQIPVLPLAAGWGITTPAGRGGEIIRVTNLNPSGPGSLADALLQSGPRVIIFEVSGTIVLTDWLLIDKPFVTVAGQTAPSPGITIRGAGIRIRTHDVLLQHLRVRIGDGPGPAPLERDCLEILSNEQDCYNIVVDHCSFSWGIDENVSIYSPNSTYTNHDITIRYCIISEGLFHSIHPDGQHSMGLLVGGDSGGRHDSIAFVGNLMAHNNQRNPMSQSRTLVNVNNVTYNSGEYGATMISEGAINKSSLAGNVFIPGTDTDTGTPITLSKALLPGSEIYLEDNLSDGFDNPFGNYAAFNPLVGDAPAWPAGLVAKAGSIARLNAVANAGARPGDRDAVDTRIINDVLYGTGSLIDSQDDVGGWPVLAVNTRTLATPPNPHGDADGDGYSNLEEWLHSYSSGVNGIGTNRMLAVVSPNGGETLVADSLRSIQWESTGTINQVKIEYSLNGTDWILIAANALNTLSYPWVIPRTPSATALIRLTAVNDPTVTDQSDGNFTIALNAPVSTLFSDGFESGTVPGANWLTSDWNAASGLDFWGDISTSQGGRAHTGTKSVYCAANSNAPGQTYDVNQNTYLIQVPGVSLTGYSNIRMSYWIWYRTYDVRDYVRLEYERGSQWVELERFSGSGSGSQVWTERTFDVPADAGPLFKFRWVFYSSDSFNSEGVYIDDVAITGNPGFAMPANITSDVSAKPAEVRLDQNYPNPFNPTTRISFSIPNDAHVVLKVYNILGQEVARLIDGPVQAGQHSVEFGGGSLADGVYFSTMEVEGTRFIQKMILLK